MTRRPASIPGAYFEDLYAGDADPWEFATSDYEREKYDATLSAIGGGHRRALEVGCSIGVFTRRLAERCDRLVAVDVAEAALADARRRCADRSNIEFQRMQLPAEVPSGRFDLIILSEVGYYWSLADLDRFLVWLRQALTADGLFALVHWTGETDYPLTGDAVHDHVATAVQGHLHPVRRALNPSYRLDVFAGPDRL
jgi:predicted TPR repeat methyltransferase